MAPKKAFLIDGTAFCYRAFYAIRSLSTPDGRPTNAVYGVAMMVQALQEKERPDYLAVAFDVGKPTFRHHKFEAYKVQRKPMPDPLVQQIPVVKALLKAYRIPLFELEGFEGEDVLATIATRIAGQEVDVFLVTGDKDALQLVNEHIKVYNPHKDHGVLDAASVQARYGVEPAQVVDLMALMGDPIDNIPGVPGIGEKTATRLLQEFGTLEGLYGRLGEIDSAAQRKSLAESKSQVELSRELAQIDTNVPIAVRLSDLERHEPDWRAVRALYRELDFRKLMASVNARMPVESGPAVTVHLAGSAPELQALTARLAARGTATSAVLCWPVPMDLPGGVAPSGIVIAIALAADEAWVVQADRELFRTSAGQALAAWLKREVPEKLSHDGKAAKRLFAHWGLSLSGLAGDTMLAAYLLNPARTHQALSDVMDELLDERLGPLPEIRSTGESGDLFSSDAVAATGPSGPKAKGRPRAAAQRRASQVEVSGGSPALEPFGRYACAVVRIHQVLRPRLEERALGLLYTDLELPLLDVLTEMELLGVAVDLPYLAGLNASMQATLRQLTEEIYRLAGCEFNLNSPKQLAHVLFEELNLPVIKRTKTGASTDSDVLRQLAERHPLPAQLVQYRELAKLVSTYVEALPRLADPQTRRIHTTFNQTATATGRLSSSEPNLQNIPIRTELGRSIRKAFIPGIQDGVLLAADYSQIELRILAHLSGDEQLVDAFRHERDIHRVTASLIYGVPEGEIQPEQRYAMKAVNFGILYGMSAHGLSKELGVPFEEAQQFIDAYFQRYPRVREYLDRQIAQAKRDGFVQTLLGRRRYVPEVNSPDQMTRQFGERMAVNAPIQGSAADLIKRAMVELARRMPSTKLGGRLLLQVHDELVFESPRRELAELVAFVRETMEGAIALDVPLRVTAKAGPNWLDLEPVQ